MYMCMFIPILISSFDLFWSSTSLPSPKSAGSNTWKTTRSSSPKCMDSSNLPENSLYTSSLTKTSHTTSRTDGWLITSLREGPCHRMTCCCTLENTCRAKITGGSMEQIMKRRAMDGWIIWTRIGRTGSWSLSWETRMGKGKKMSGMSIGGSSSWLVQNSLDTTTARSGSWVTTCSRVVDESDERYEWGRNIYFRSGMDCTVLCVDFIVGKLHHWMVLYDRKRWYGSHVYVPLSTSF